MIDRTFSAPPTLARLGLAVQRLRADAASAGTELVTGRIDNAPRVLGAALGEAHLLRKSIDDASDRLASARLAGQRAALIQSSLTAIREGGAGLGAEAVAAASRGDGTGLDRLAARAGDEVRAVFSRLGVRFGETTLFSGDAVDRPPLADPEALLADVAAIVATGPDAAAVDAALDAYFNDPAGGFATTIYQGGVGFAPRADLGDGETATLAVRADDAALKTMIRALATFAADPRGESGGAAARRLLTAADDVARLSAGLGETEARIETASVRIAAEQVGLEAAYNALTARDPFDAATRLRALETQLEAAYVATSRISQLSLSNYI